MTLYMVIFQSKLVILCSSDGVFIKIAVIGLRWVKKKTPV